MILEQAERRLKAMHDNGGVEQQHEEADQILCDCLIEAGYEEIALAYLEAKERVGFWYV